jgi:hypothetical protein
MRNKEWKWLFVILEDPQVSHWYNHKRQSCHDNTITSQYCNNTM